MGLDMCYKAVMCNYHALFSNFEINIFTSNTFIPAILTRLSYDFKSWWNNLTFFFAFILPCVLILEKNAFLYNLCTVCSRIFLSVSILLQHVFYQKKRSKNVITLSFNMYDFRIKFVNDLPLNTGIVVQLGLGRIIVFMCLKTFLSIVKTFVSKSIYSYNQSKMINCKMIFGLRADGT